MKEYLLVALLLFLLCSCHHDKQAQDFAFVGDYSLGLEGPAVDASGSLFFVNPQKSGTIGKLTEEGQFELFVESLPNGSIANGIRFSAEGDLLMADYVNHNILIIDAQTQKLTVYAHHDSLNQPNDIAISENGMLFASDPDWSTKSGQLWRITTDGEFQLLETDMGTTNGVEVAPGDSILYINESVQRKIWRYDLSDEGELSNKKLLISFEDHGLDGMRTDVRGNLYVARYGKGVIAKISPQGQMLEEIKLSAKKPTNLAFGGPKGTICYVTCQDRGWIESFIADYPGRSWSMHGR